jgi:hypothetical protein
MIGCSIYHHGYFPRNCKSFRDKNFSFLIFISIFNMVIALTGVFSWTKFLSIFFSKRNKPVFIPTNELGSFQPGLFCNPLPVFSLIYHGAGAAELCAAARHAGIFFSLSGVRFVWHNLPPVLISRPRVVDPVSLAAQPGSP